MKKASIISIIVFFAVITFMAFSFNAGTDVQKTSIDNPRDPILVHVKGCDNCKKVFVCVNGRISYNFTSCDFYVSCDPTGSVIQTICVVCEESKTGSVTINCPLTKEITIPVSMGGTACPCR